MAVPLHIVGNSIPLLNLAIVPIPVSFLFYSVLFDAVKFQFKEVLKLSCILTNGL